MSTYTVSPGIETQQDFRDYDLSNFYFGSGNDVNDTIAAFNNWWDTAVPEGYHIYRESLTTPPDTVICIDGNMGEHMENMINFSSYNYLGMANHEVVKNAAIEAIKYYGLGASGGPILSGVFDIHRELERNIAAFKGKEACTTFNSGYAANVGIISGLMRAGDTVYIDQYAHASIIDGAVLSKARIVMFRHNNAADLDKKLKDATGRKLVVVEGVYSMDGDMCQLPGIVEAARKNGARIMIDEAHSSFICGENGRGVAEHFGMEDEIDFHMGTFSKALGGIGGYVCGSKDFTEYMEAYARSRFFSCTLPPAVTAGILASLRHVIANPGLRHKLRANVDYLRNRFAEEGVDIAKSDSHVVPIMVHDDRKIFELAQRLRDAKLYLQPVAFPAVSKGKARLRLSVSANHTADQLEYAAQTIPIILKQCL